MRDDRAVEKWLSLEMGKLQQGLVLAPRPLGDLVLEAAPSAPTRGGGTHAFDAAVLARLHAALSPLERRRVRLPVTFFVQHETPEDAYLADAPAVGLLRALGEVAPGFDLREGKAWLGHARARAIAQRHPTAFQFAHL